MGKKVASSSGDTSAVDPWTTQAGWLQILDDFKKAKKPESMIKRVEDIIEGFRDIPNYLPQNK
jgi:hypothetical protein